MMMGLNLGRKLKETTVKYFYHTKNLWLRPIANWFVFDFQSHFTLKGIEAILFAQGTESAAFASWLVSRTIIK